MNKILIVHTSWYSEYINEMVQIATSTISDSGYQYETTCAPGAIELAALGKHHIVKNKSPYSCLLYTSPSPRDGLLPRMPSSA